MEDFLDFKEGGYPPSYNPPPKVGCPDLVSRLEWGARTPVADFVEWLPVPYVVIDSTGGDGCYDHQTCCRAVRDLQAVHMDQLNDTDIQYNFLLGQDGMVYEGKGWTNKASRKFRGYRNLTHRYIFAFIGSHDLDNPPKILYDKLLDLLRYAKANNYVKSNFQLLDIKVDGSISKYDIELYANWFYFLTPILSVPVFLILVIGRYYLYGDCATKIH